MQLKWRKFAVIDHVQPLHEHDGYEFSLARYTPSILIRCYNGYNVGYAVH